MTSLEVEELRKELEGIQVRGKGNVPKPIKKWSQCGVSHRILETMKKLNYEKPTPIQVWWSLTQSQISFLWTGYTKPRQPDKIVPDRAR